MKDIVYSRYENRRFKYYHMANKGNTPWNKGLKTNQRPHNSLNLNRDELYNLYIEQQLTSKEIAEIYGCTSKAIRNWLYKFDIPVRPMADAVKLQRSHWTPEQELARAQKYHQTWVNKPQEEKDLATQKRLDHPNTNSPDSLYRAQLTRLNNKTTNISKSEEDFLNKLLILGFEKDDIIHPYYGPKYGDNRYPFNCDFYIPSKDLFIEYQGHQTHGPEPYDENNPKHLELLIKYQDNGYDMSTWFKRDPNKIKLAKENKINLLLVYPRDKTYLITNGNMKTVDLNEINKI